MSMCPDEDILQAFLDGRLTGADRDEIHRHVDGCRDCTELLAALACRSRDQGTEDIALSSTLAGAPAGPGPEREPRPPFLTTPWDKYEFVRLLGQGGMGTVYQARDRLLGRLLALKFLRGDDPLLAVRLLQEARAQARVIHDHVCRVYEVGEVAGRPYIAMEYVAGGSLGEMGREMTLPDRVQVIRDVALALHEAHKVGIIHRDLKPDNILVERLGDGRWRPVVMDFGLARQADDNRGLTRSGTVMGTPAYMPPEQARGEVRSLDRRSDVYSLGATLYELLCERPPFEGEQVMDVLLAVLNEEPRPVRSLMPRVPVDLETIVLKCLAKEPSRRYDSARALAEDLQRYIEGEPIFGRRTSLAYRLRRRAQRNKTAVALLGASLLVMLALSGYGVRSQVLGRRREVLAGRLGQEIKDMEWLLRSARQLPLHDLGREKGIVRQRMAQLQVELAGYGQRGQGLAHYAIGRGHMALHEYPQALEHLRTALAEGNESAEVHYALGYVLGKHYEQALYEVRLSGGGEWARKQVREIEPRYLTPAIESLKRSRTMKLDAPAYLEGLIAFYQRDYDAALRHADAALRKAPWLYEAAQLAGDVHHERALQARDSGRYEEAAGEFAAAVRRYEEAAETGRSDAQVHEGLAESWVRQIEMAYARGQPVGAAYERALAAADRIMAAEPEGIAGPLKRAFAVYLTMQIGGASIPSEERVQACVAAAQAVLDRQPGHPQASNVLADCYGLAAEKALARGQDPEPLLRQGIALLEPVLRQHPAFLWGLNGLGCRYNQLGTLRWTRRDPAAKASLETAIAFFAKASRLDPGYLWAVSNALWAYALLLAIPETPTATRDLLAAADSAFSRCISLNSRHPECYNNYAIGYAQAALRAHLGGEDPRPRLARALEAFAMRRKLGGAALDAEQHEALAHLVDAMDRVRRQENPAPALGELDAALSGCLGLAKTDAMCRTLAAQGEHVRADWLAQVGQPPGPALQRALTNASLATQSPEIYPDAWQVLAETHLRLASARSELRARHLAAGLAALEKVFAINPGHARGRATEGELCLLRAQGESTPEAARCAVRAFEQAIRGDPLLAHDHAARLVQARTLAPAP